VPLAPPDSLLREIHQVLDLIKPIDLDDEVGYNGYCGAATEAYLYLAGGRDAPLEVKQRQNPDGSSHWWLEGDRGVIDLTLGAADRRELRAHPRKAYPYGEGIGRMFRNGYDRPSKRAAAIVALVHARRSGSL
jgi:hypothetical protein